MTVNFDLQSARLRGNPLKKAYCIVCKALTAFEGCGKGEMVPLKAESMLVSHVVARPNFAAQIKDSNHNRGRTS